jgi:hypothetical protein
LCRCSSSAFFDRHASINFVNLATGAGPVTEVGAHGGDGQYAGWVVYSLRAKRPLITPVATAIALGLFQFGQTLVHSI